MSDGYEIHELSRIETAIDAIESPTSADVFQATRPFDERAIASVAAQRATNGGGGGSVLTPDANFCNFQIAPTVTLTPGAAFYKLTPADLSIASQSGTDFSIGNSGDFPPLGDSGAIISAGGGWFTAACYIGAPVGVTLDAGSTEARWLEVFYSIGFALDNPFGLICPSGVDFFLPVGPAYGDVADLRVSVPMYSAPGHPVLHNFGAEFVNGFGTDAISAPLGNTGNMILWQVA